jgi:hypothetical protein
VDVQNGPAFNVAETKLQYVLPSTKAQENSRLIIELVGSDRPAAGPLRTTIGRVGNLLFWH